MAAQPVVISATSSCVSSADYLRVYSTSASNSLTKLSSTAPSIDRSDTAQGIRVLISGLQLDFGPLIRTLRAPQFIRFSVDLTIHLPCWYFLSLLWETVLTAFISICDWLYLTDILIFLLFNNCILHLFPSCMCAVDHSWPLICTFDFLAVFPCWQRCIGFRPKSQDKPALQPQYWKQNKRKQNKRTNKQTKNPTRKKPQKYSDAL